MTATPSVLTATDGGLFVQTTAGSPEAPRDAIARLTPSGTLDPSFGSGGVVEIAGQSVRAIALTPAGGVVVAGSVAAGQNELHLALTRLTAAGVPDKSFGGDGTVSDLLPGAETPAPSRSTSKPRAL